MVFVQETSCSYKPRNTSINHKICRSCGRPLENCKRRYCSKDCKDDFLFKLKWFNNLLRAINTKYATFMFTESVLVLNILPFRTQNVLTYFYQRKPGKKPSQDMNKMVFQLGELWWGHKEKSKSNRQASNKILEKGQKNIFHWNYIKPREIKYPANITKQLMYLKISKSELLHSCQAIDMIKTAYRQAALKHHPDTGGDSETFRKIHQAYLDLINWVNRPAYCSRKGVPGQWSYIAGKSTWISPL